MVAHHCANGLVWVVPHMTWLQLLGLSAVDAPRAPSTLGCHWVPGREAAKQLMRRSIAVNLGGLRMVSDAND